MNPRSLAFLAALVGSLAFASVASPADEGSESSSRYDVPTPTRLPDGKPNWTGFWSPLDSLLERNFGDAFEASTRASAAVRARLSPYSPLKSPYKERYEAVLKDA